MATSESRAAVIVALVIALVAIGAPSVCATRAVNSVAVQWNLLFNVIHCRSSGSIIENNIILAQLHLAQWHALLALRRLKDPGTTDDIVVAYASHTVLSNYFPFEQWVSIDPLLLQQLQELGATDSEGMLGKRIGEAVAISVVDTRRPGREFALQALKSALNSDSNSPDPGVYRYLNNTPAGRAATTFVFYDSVSVKPFVVPAPLKFISTYLSDLRPPRVPSSEWNREYDLVKDAARAGWKGRTAEMNFTAAAVGCPRVGSSRCSITHTWSAAARATLVGETLYDTVITFAKMAVTLHDAQIILATLQYGFWFWRPEMAMKAGDADHAPIPDWTPWFRTPPHAEYPSGTVTTAAAAAATLQKYFDKRSIAVSNFTLTDGGVFIAACPVQGPVPDLPVSSFADLVAFMQRARIWSGAHYNKSVVDAVAVGEAVAKYVEKHWDEPTPSGVLPHSTYLNVVAKLPRQSGDWSPIVLEY